MMGLRFAGDIPFDDVYVHSVIQAPDGRRMSKSLGTGIDPLDLIDGGLRPPVFAPDGGDPGEFPAYGADAVRFGLLAMSSSQDVRFSEEKVAQGRALANKLFNASRLILMTADPEVAPAPRPETIEDRWILSRLQAALRDSQRLLDDYDFSKLVLGLYDFVFTELCDWYLEMIKRRDRTERAVGDAAARPAIDARARASLHPVCDRGAVGPRAGQRGPAGRRADAGRR